MFCTPRMPLLCFGPEDAALQIEVPNGLVDPIACRGSEALVPGAQVLEAGAVLGD